VVDEDRPPFTDEVAAAAADVARLRIMYLSASSHHLGERVVTPRLVVGYPYRAVRWFDDAIEVDLTVADEQWLDELLVRVGARGRVVSPADWADRGAAAAKRLLALYEATGNADN